uniref:Secreted protein n=1 Tax=Parascaris univalens TaxID=6257 RepID=A0A915BFA1_PARUN
MLRGVWLLHMCRMVSRRVQVRCVVPISVYFVQCSMKSTSKSHRVIKHRSNLACHCDLNLLLSFICTDDAPHNFAIIYCW